MKKQLGRNLLKVMFFFLPLGLTIYGYLSIHEETFLNAAFIGVAMYVMNYGDTPPNIYVEIARWMAPLATASGLILIFITLREKARREITYLCGGSIAVYGDGADVVDILAQIKRKGIQGPENQMVRAERYILMYTDERNSYDFYRRNLDVLSEKQVYIKSSILRPQETECDNLHFFQYEEAQSRAYWKEQSLIQEAIDKEYQLRIVLIGGGKLGESLLVEGLQKNIFHPDQRIEYHVFYVDPKYIACRPGIQRIADPVVFHEEEWYHAIPCLDEADRILVSDQMNDIEFLQDLLAIVPYRRIDVFSHESELLNRLFQRPDLHIYDAEQEGKKLENILNEALFEQAKLLNWNYEVLYGADKKEQESKEILWSRLDAFTRYSNVNSVDYHEIRIQMLKILTGSEQTDPDTYLPYLELFSELEHIRWCRYHFLNDWDYGIPANGKAKDPKLRIHRSLLPYRCLSEEEKDKDRDTVRFMFERG